MPPPHSSTLDGQLPEPPVPVQRNNPSARVDAEHGYLLTIFPNVSLTPQTQGIVVMADRPADISSFLSARLSRRLALMSARSRARGHRREKLAQRQEGHEVRSRLIDEERIRFDLIDGRWNDFDL